MMLLLLMMMRAWLMKKKKNKKKIRNDDGVVVMMLLWWWCCCCCDGDGDGKKWLWRSMFVGNIFFGVCPAGVLVVSRLCFGGRWCLGGTLVVCPSCLDSVRWCFGDTLLLGLYAGLILLFVQSECRPDTNYQPWQLIQDLIAIMVVNVQSYAKLGNGGKRFRCKHTRPWRQTRACTETKTQNRFAAFALAKYIHFTVARTSTRKTRVFQTNDKKEEPIHHCWQKLVASWFLQKFDRGAI